MPPPAVGQPGGIHDDARIEIAHGRPTLTFGPIPDLTAIENAAKLGVKMLNYHGYWSSDFGLPRVPDESRLAMKALLEACKKHDIRLNLYFGYGLGHAVPESRLYDDYWGIEPRTFWGLDMGRFGFVVANNAVQVYTDYMLDGIQTLFREWPLGGLYYDHVQTPNPDQNLHNGSGWIDENGKLRTRVQVRPARRFIKRLYAIAKQANPDSFIDSHGSSFVNPIRAAWVDRMWIGELFRPTNYKFDFDIVTVKCVGAPYGMPSDFLVMSEGLPFDWHKEWHRSLTYTLPHDVEPRALLPYSYRLQRDTMAKLWEIKGAFDTENAEWWPYWKNGDYATVTGKACVTSFHLHRGRRALVVVSNVSGEGPVEATLQLDLAAMGLQGRARDAWTGEAAPLEQGRADVRLNAHDMRLLWVE